MIACFKEENAGKTLGAFRVMYPLIETAACHFIIMIEKLNIYLIIRSALSIRITYMNLFLKQIFILLHFLLINATVSPMLHI